MSTLAELRERPHHSYSSLNTFLNVCPLQYAMRYVYKMESEKTSVNLPFGSAFHGALSWLSARRMNGDPVDIEVVKEVFSECWRVECDAAVGLKFRSDDEWDALNEQGRKMIATFYYEGGLADEVLDVGRAFSVPIIDAEGETVSEKPLIGEIDLVVMDERGKTVIVDWKTSATRWAEGKADFHFQATCFCYAWARENKRIPSFRYAVITKTKAPSYEKLKTVRKTDDFHRLAELVKVVERAIANDLFFPMAGGYACKDCPHSRACANWHRNQSRTLFTQAA